MSQGYEHGGILSSFSDEYGRREKLRVLQGFDINNINPLLVPVLHEGGGGGGADHHHQQQPINQNIYEPPPAAGSAGNNINMLSEMFNYHSDGAAASTDHQVLLAASQFPVNFRQRAPPGGDHNWYWMNNNNNNMMISSSIEQHATSSVPSPPTCHHDIHLHNNHGSSTFPMVSFGAGLVEGTGHEGCLSLSLASNINHRAPIGLVNVLRGSKFARPAKELLEEFCSMGRGKLKSTAGRSTNPNPNPNPNSTSACRSSSSSPTKDAVVPPLSPADRFEHQRKKAKLLSMLDEVERRYNHYCDQMQMVVNSYDAVMGYGSATPYTALAQKAMSRHFRCLKEAVTAQLKQTCELLGDKKAASSCVSSGITKGDTPRLKILDQSLRRRQRAFHHLGIMEQEAWRPQRGLPERSVNVLRAWLFEHFLHPYPSDADKHLLARQTGLSKNQVANWFINARVRLWKPMVEEMYQREAKEGVDDHDEERSIEGRQQIRAQSPTQQQQQQNTDQRPETNALESDISSHSQQGPTSISMHHHRRSSSDDAILAASELDVHGVPGDEMFRFAAVYGDVANALVAGDVSLTLGLRHAGNSSTAAPENNRFALRDCGG